MLIKENKELLCLDDFENYPKFVNYEEEVCSICLDNIDKSKCSIKTNCNHLFHLECLTQSHKIFKYTCPNCRQQSNKVIIHKVNIYVLHGEVKNELFSLIIFGFKFC